MTFYPKRNLLLGCALLLSVFPLAAQTQTCTNFNFIGTYSYTFNGSVVASNQTVPYAEIGTLVADGQGGLTGTSFSAQNGIPASAAFSGTYMLNPSCTGSIILSINSQPVALNFQLVNDGSSAILEYSSPTGAIAAGQAYRTTTVAGTQCGNGSLNGSYGYLLSGTLAGAPYSEEGQFTANGNGSLMLSSILNNNGTVTQVPGSGSYSLQSDCSGTVQITDQFGAHAYRIEYIPSSRLALLFGTSVGAVITGSAQPETLTTSILPDVVSGGGFYTALYFTNQTNVAIQFPVSFFGDDGNPLTVPSIGTSIATISVQPNGTAILQLPNTGSLVQGYATVSLPAGVTAYGVFRKSATGVTDQEAYVPLVSASTTMSTLTFDETNVSTAVAIVNPSALASVVTITARDPNGNVIGTSTVSLAAHAKTEAVLRNLPGLNGIVGLRGSVVFSVATGNVSVLGLRFDGSAFTAVPTTNQ